MAKGLCSSCYLKLYRENPENQKRIKQQKEQWYYKKDRTLEQKTKREERYFDNKRSFVLQRDNFQCLICKSIKQLIVHHIDMIGRNSRNPNNDLDNLQTLCKACHAKIHSVNLNWARHWKACIICGTTNHKHNARGFCTACYWKFNSKDMVCSSKKLEEN